MRHSATRDQHTPCPWRATALVLPWLVACCAGQKKHALPASPPTAAPHERSAPERPAPEHTAPPEPAATRRSNSSGRQSEAEITVAPRPAEPSDPALAPWLARCGVGDQALHEVAQEIARLAADGDPLPEPEWTVDRLRRRGAPYVQPRVWSARLSAASDPADAELRLERWAQRRARGVLRCGIGEVATEGEGRTVALIQVDARADLDPVPTRSAVGTWIDWTAHLRVPATGAAAVVLPPEGSPRALTLREEGPQLGARFLLDQPGPWLIQVLANDEGGALPVLEAEIQAGEGSRRARWRVEVPGEKAAPEGAGGASALLAMLNEARRLAGLPAVFLDPTLTRLADDHARALGRREAVTHDAGDGSPERRVEAAGLTVRHLGENVARAPSILRIYRALWASPSHRGNLLYPHYGRVGIGVREGADGMLHASLLFTDAP